MWVILFFALPKNLCKKDLVFYRFWKALRANRPPSGYHFDLLSGPLERIWAKCEPKIALAKKGRNQSRQFKQGGLKKVTHAKNATRSRQEPAKDSPKRELLETKWGGGTPPKGGFQLNKNKIERSMD